VGGVIKASNAAALPAFVQTKSTTISGTSLTATFNSNVTATHSVLVVVDYQVSLIFPATASDTLGNTYTSIANIGTGSAAGMQVFLAPNVTGGADTVTATNGSGQTMSTMSIYEVASVATSPLDGTPVTFIGSSVTPTFTVGPITTTGTNDYLFTALVYAGMTPQGAGPVGYTVLNYTGAINGIQAADKVAPTPGGYSAVWDSSTVGGPPILSVLVALKESCGAAQTANLPSLMKMPVVR